MSMEKDFLQGQLIGLIDIAMETRHTIQSGILLATVIDYMAYIDQHKHENIPKVKKGTLITFVKRHLDRYITEVNDYLDSTKQKKEYAFDEFTAEDFVEVFYRLKHSFCSYTNNRGFEFTFYGTIGGIAVIMADGNRKQVCLNVGHLAEHVEEVINCYFSNQQKDTIKRAIKRYCDLHDTPYALGLFKLDL